MVNFSASEERFFKQVREVGREFKKLNPGMTPAQFEKKIPDIMRTVLDRQAYVMKSTMNNPALIQEMAREVYESLHP